MTTSPSTFLNLINNEIDLLKALSVVLTEERQSIEANAIAQLPDLADKKKQLLDHIEKASQRRNEFLLAAIQAPTAKQRLEKYIQQADASTSTPHHKQAFEKLEACLDECKTNNDVNARIIAMNQRHIDRNLNILKGIDNNSVTYDQSGATRTAKPTLSGVKA